MAMATKRSKRTRKGSESSISVSTQVAGRVATRPPNLDGKHVPLIRLFAQNKKLKKGDKYAGGGGASLGITSAIAKLAAKLGLDLTAAPDVAINHDPEAIAMHKVNHPETRHYIEDIFAVDPRKVLADVDGEKFGFLWASPSCTAFSRAKGSPLNASTVKLRGLCWSVTSWAARVDIDCICMENVEEFQKFGPLHKTHSVGCSKEYAATLVWNPKKRKKVARGCKKNCHYCTPIKERIGSLSRAFIRRLEKLGYVVETRVLRAHDFGAPTKRKRWFLVARKDGKPIVWPEPTHGAEGSGLIPYLTTASDVIDWSIPCKSIFDRPKPLADKTLRRIARGVEKFVLQTNKPFIVPTSYGDKGGTDVRVYDTDEPAPVICGNRSSLNLVDPVVFKVKTYGGGGNDAKSVHEPIGAVLTSKRGEHAIAAPVAQRVGSFIAPNNTNNVPVSVEDRTPTVTTGGRNLLGEAIAAPVIVRTAHGEVDKNGKKRGQGAHSVDESIGTVCASSKDFAVAEAIAVPYMVHRSNGERREVVKPDGSVIPGQAPRVYDVQDPHPTVVSGGVKTGLSLAYLVKHNGGNNDRNGNMSGQDLRRGMDTVSTRDSKALAEIRAAHVMKLRGTSDAHIEASASSMEEPTPAVSAQGGHLAQVAAYLVRYNGTGDAETVESPLGTPTAKPRFGLVHVTLAKDVCKTARRVAKFLGYDKPLIVVINGEQWVLVDIAMRMLVARELFNAQGFPKTFKIDFDEHGNPFTETAKIRMCGNSVPPPLAEAIAMAQLEAA